MSSEETESENLILFFFLGISWGGVLTFFLSKYSLFPYTVSVFFSGILISVLVAQLPEHRLESFGHSVRKWQEIDPHLMLYLFLPILIYGDAISLNWTQVKRALAQAIILAGPGVLMSAFLMGLFVYFCTNLGWSWYLCMLFGAILSGTDPVAVVALLKDVNTSTRLFMLIIGESLLNDGTSIVLYTLYYDLAKGEHYSPRNVVSFFVKMLCGSPLVGIGLGLVSVYCLQTASRSLSATDRTLQIVVTLCCAYLAFYFSEKTFRLSGILACGAAGIMISKKGLPYLVEIETMHLIWELLEWFGNTMIFFLAGVIFGGKAIKYSVTGEDFLILILLYVMLMLFRVFILACLYPVISRIGLGCAPKELVFMSWSGLRGSLAMALGLAVFGERKQLHIDDETADRFFFFVGGISTLTLLINAPLAPRLLKYLGLIVTTGSSPELVSIQKKVDHQLRHLLEKEIERFLPPSDGMRSRSLELESQTPVHLEMPSPDISITGSVSKNFPIDVQQIKNHMTIFRSLPPPRRDSGGSGDVLVGGGDLSEEFLRSSQHSVEPRTSRLSLHHHLVTSDHRLVYCRHMFLTCLRAQYWKWIHEGHIPRNDTVTECLLYSVEHAIHHKSDPLCDWFVVSRELSSPLWVDQVIQWAHDISPEWFPVHSLCLTEQNKRRYLRIYILINFISGNEKVQVEIHDFLDDHEKKFLTKKGLGIPRSSTGVNDEDNRIWFERSSEYLFNEIDVIIEESKANVRLALSYLQSLDHSLVSSLMWMIQTRALLGSEAEHIEHLVNEGLLTPHSAEDYLDTIRQDIRVLDHEKHKLFSHPTIPPNAIATPGLTSPPNIPNLKNEPKTE